MLILLPPCSNGLMCLLDVQYLYIVYYNVTAGFLCAPCRRLRRIVAFLDFVTVRTARGVLSHYSSTVQYVAAEPSGKQLQYNSTFKCTELRTHVLYCTNNMDGCIEPGLRF